nr:uncharacterized protein LOC105346946 isoform X2 [Crassostrea gigas]
MKLPFLLVFLGITWCLIGESEGSWWRKRRCRRICIAKYCRTVCLGKRSEVSGSSPLPCNFAAWDKNGDDHVDLEEFSSVAYPNVKEGDLALAFQSTDTDENQQISKSELHKAEIMFGIC